MYGIRFFLRVQVATNIPGHGYASANANRPEVVMSINFSANIFGQTFRPSFFCRKGAPRKWILSTQRIARGRDLDGNFGKWRVRLQVT